MSQGSIHYPFKWVNDPIHGHIQLDKFILEYVDTTQFQRLRDLKQLGCAYYVFPGASHNRFEHSIGVCHLAGQLTNMLKTSQPELMITSREEKCLKIAGLCHDLGHGPFSHVFDNEFLHVSLGSKSFHEQRSEMMLDYLVDENGIDIENDDVNFIKALIQGNVTKSVKDEGRGFLFEIVANKRNSVDVDKFDYISRDCLNVGIKSSYDFSRLMNFCRVINGQICYHSKEVFNMYEMFHTRYSLFKRIYTHRVGKAIELMITDAFLAADPFLKISDRVNDPQQFQYLTDHILHEIECSTLPELSPARSIVIDIRKRNLYKFVDEIIVPIHLLAHLSKEKVNAKEIICWAPDNSYLNEEDLIVEWLKINYAMKDKNPVDHIRFYSRFNDQESFIIPKSKVSLVIPEHFEENIVRIFARDPEKMVDIQKAFRRWVENSPLGQTTAILNPVHAFPSNFESPPRYRASPPDKKRRTDT